MGKAKLGTDKKKRNPAGNLHPGKNGCSNNSPRPGEE
jgi:hypothetical protein